MADIMSEARGAGVGYDGRQLIIQGSEAGIRQVLAQVHRAAIVHLEVVLLSGIGKSLQLDQEDIRRVSKPLDPVLVGDVLAFLVLATISLHNFVHVGADVALQEGTGQARLDWNRQMTLVVATGFADVTTSITFDRRLQYRVVKRVEVLEDAMP